MEVIVAVIAGAVVALALGWFVWSRALAALRSEIVEYRVRVGQHAVEVRAQQERIAELAGAEAARERLAEELSGLKAGQAERDAGHKRQLVDLETAFAGLAAKALDGAQARFAVAAEEALVRHREAAGAGLTANRTAMAELIAPMRETLGLYEAKLGEIEKARAEAYGGLKEQVTALAIGNARVSDEAAKLVSALRSSGKTSGSWGEQQLRNTLDMAGLREGIDYSLQTSVDGEDGKRRPDAIINLPGGRQLIIDSKCSLKDYLDAGNAADDDGRRAAHKRHSAAVRAHAKGLGDKNYWKDFGRSADFVVMFLPGENFLSAALEHDLPLLGWAFDQRILLAGPINLLAIAKTVALVWRQETLAEEAKAIGELGAQLHAAIAVMAEHLAGVGKNLGQAVNGYNEFVGSLERNVLPKARRFTELGVERGKKSIPLLPPIEAFPRVVTATELLAAPVGGVEIAAE